MDSEFKKYYEGDLSLMDQADFQCRISEGQKSMEESMLEAFMNECDKPEDEADGLEAMMAKVSFTKVASTLGLDNADIAARKKNDRKYRILKWACGTAAGIIAVLACSLAFVLGNPDTETEWMEVCVPNGDKSELVLADGTKLHLNSGTRVTYPSAFGEGERRIFVEGEIFAEVTADSEHPFVVHTENMDVRVLGTTFNLRAYRNSDCVEVFLIEGKVQCEINDGNSITMNLGNVVQYDRLTGETEIHNASTASFKPGFASMHFFNLTLNDIAKELERRFNTEIVIMNEKLSQTEYFAIFSNGESLDEILFILNSDKTMNISKKSGKIYIR